MAAAHDQPDDIIIRPVQLEDADHGFFQVLSQLTDAPKLPSDRFRVLLDHQRRQDLRLTVVAVDSRNRVLATGSVMIEPKFIRGGKPCGHIEDIVVDQNARGSHLGKRIISHLIHHCKSRECYKIILDCSDQNVPFYEKCGFQIKGTQMSLYL